MGEVLPIVYSLDICPNCEKLKTYLKDHGVDFIEKDLSDSHNIVDILYASGKYVQEAPVLQVENKYYESSEIFGKNGEINGESFYRAC